MLMLAGVHVVAFKEAFLPCQQRRCHYGTTTQLASGDRMPYFSDPDDGNRNGRKLTPAQRAIQKKLREEDNVNEFDRFKNTLYDGFDSLQSMASGKGSDAPIIKGGYSEIETEALLGKLPPRSILPSFKSPSTPALPTASKSPLTAQSIFASIKEAVYGTMDAASKLSAASGDKTTNIVAKEVVATVDSKALLRMRELFPDLQSDNPFKRAAAEFQFQVYKQKEDARKANLARQETLRKLKDDAYKLSDAIVAAAETVGSLPAKLEEGAKTTVNVVSNIPGKVQNAVDQIQTMPTNVQQTVNDWIATTKQFVQGVKALPDKAQQAAVESKQGFESLVVKVNEVTTNTKVMLGLEKPKPKPPKAKPPEKLTSADAILTVAGTFAFGAGKFILWATTSVAEASFSALVRDTKDSKSTTLPRPSTKAPNVVETTPKTAKPAPPKVVSAVVKPPIVEPPAPSNDVDSRPRTKPPPVAAPTENRNESDLDMQVREALQLASEALQQADERKKERTRDDDE
jgi:hypothetical protein